MTATAGFLCELSPGQIAHTALSSPFVTNLTYLDAGMFLAETAAPAALHMTNLAQSHNLQETMTTSAYTVAFDTAETFETACAERSQLRRRWMAYRRCVQDPHDSVAELLARLNWNALGSACIVDVSALSTLSFDTCRSAGLRTLTPSPLGGRPIHRDRCLSGEIISKTPLCRTDGRAQRGTARGLQWTHHGAAANTHGTPTCQGRRCLHSPSPLGLEATVT